MCDRRIRDEPFYIGLYHRDESSVDNSYNRENDEYVCEIAALVGKQREIESHQAVCSHLEKYRGEYDRTGSRRFGMRVRQPSVEREQGHLDGERDRESEEKQCTGPWPCESQFAELYRLDKRHIIKCLDTHRVRVNIIKSDDRSQHQQAAERSEQKELDRRIYAIYTDPDDNEEEHWHQCC